MFIYRTKHRVFPSNYGWFIPEICGDQTKLPLSNNRAEGSVIGIIFSSLWGVRLSPQFLCFKISPFQIKLAVQLLGILWSPFGCLFIGTFNKCFEWFLLCRLCLQSHLSNYLFSPEAVRINQNKNMRTWCFIYVSRHFVFGCFCSKCFLHQVTIPSEFPKYFYLWSFLFQFFPRPFIFVWIHF